MKKLIIPLIEFIGRNDTVDWVCSRLKDGGFDIDRPIDGIVNPSTGEYIYTQEDELCIYCYGGVSISTKNRENLGIELHSGTKQLVAYGKDKTGYDISVSVPIKYCPMCGRKL